MNQSTANGPTGAIRAGGGVQQQQQPSGGARGGGGQGQASPHTGSRVGPGAAGGAATSGAAFARGNQQGSTPAASGAGRQATELLALLGKNVGGGAAPPGFAQQQQHHSTAASSSHEAQTAASSLQPRSAQQSDGSAASRVGSSAFAAVAARGSSVDGGNTPIGLTSGSGGRPDDGASLTHLASSLSLYERRDGLGGKAPASAAAGPANTAPDAYGLQGLLNVIRMPDRDVHALALGYDLATLGLNLNTSDPLHSSFAYPWGDTPVTHEPHFTLPQCYKMPQPALKTGHLARFEYSTLFYMFYGMPRDILQAYAAQELYAREWRYHPELKLWFRREVAGGLSADAALSAALANGDAAAAIAAKSAGFVFWDVSSWEKRPFTGSNATALSTGFLAEEEARVKAAGAAAAAPGGANA